jgi:hypothetical protein
VEVSVSEIHRYPLRPYGFEEPLFPTGDSRRAVAEHLLAAPWLARASELEAGGGTAGRVREEPVELRRRAGGMEVVRLRAGRYAVRCAWRRRRVAEVVERWREVRRWWSEDRVDRLCFRVALDGSGEAGGAVIDLARDRRGGWLLVGVVD